MIHIIEKASRLFRIKYCLFFFIRRLGLVDEVEIDKDGKPDRRRRKIIKITCRTADVIEPQEIRIDGGDDVIMRGIHREFFIYVKFLRPVRALGENLAILCVRSLRRAQDEHLLQSVRKGDISIHGLTRDQRAEEISEISVGIRYDILIRGIKISQAEELISVFVSGFLHQGVFDDVIILVNTIQHML